MTKDILFCLSGLDAAQFIERAAPHIPLDRSLILLYVVDTRPAEELGYISRRMHGGGGVSSQHAAIMETAEQQTAEAVLNEAGEKCMQLGFNPQHIRREIRKGRPEQQIVALAHDPAQDIGLVVIGSRYKRAPNITPGPASVGHVARFVVDHSPCDVLLLR
jgi:nucleotide-binding universal stress UspA family protein